MADNWMEWLCDQEHSRRTDDEPDHWSYPAQTLAELSNRSDRIRALESELTSARTTIADLSYQLGKSQGEAEGHRLVRVGLESELAEYYKAEEVLYGKNSRGKFLEDAGTRDKTADEEVEGIWKRRAESAEYELAELRKREEWIPVAERLPDPGVWVIVVRPAGVRTAHASASGKVWTIGNASQVYDVTHWRPLPASPRPEPEHRDDGKSGKHQEQ